MKKILLSLLMLIMLTPSLACGAMMICAGKAQAAAPVEQNKPCHGHKDTGRDSDQSKKVMLFKDCTKADLFNSGDHANLQVPDNNGKTFFVAWVAIIPDYNFAPVAAHAIRGPPPDWPDLSQTQTSILLTTQRFRE